MRNLLLLCVALATPALAADHAEAPGAAADRAADIADYISWADSGSVGGIVTFAALTPADWRVARLIAIGLSYKEVARQLDRSLSTVDHHLRSIRDKLGPRSTARLVHLLNESAAKASRIYPSRACMAPIQ